MSSSFPEVHTGKQPWQRERGSGGEDSRENSSVLRGVMPVIQCDYSSPDRVIAGGRAGGEANVDGNRDALIEVGAGQDIRVDAWRSAVTTMLTAGRRIRRHNGGASLHGARADVDGKHRRRDRHRRTYCPAERHAAATLTRPLPSAVV